ncbi:MAG: OmpA family protein [Bacteroidia bacterium]|nr:OmpA family protein [Bacteroidia bacterium]
MKKLLLTLNLLFIALFSISQSGDKYFNDKDYQRAIFAYEREAPTNASLYLNLAKSYFAMQNFEKAILSLELYKEKYTSADKTYADNFIALLKRDDEKVKVENLGSVVNSSSNDFIPRILQDGKTLYFLSDKPGGTGGEDIWYSTLDASGNWSTPKNLYGLNSTSHEGILAISPDEKVAIVFGNFKGSFGGGDLFYSVKTTDGWTPPCNLGGAINSSNWESLACIGPDGKTLIYSTDKGNGNKSDLYITFLSENGWSTPKSIGNINTSSNEKYPFLASDGKTLYFSTDGRFGFGGTDMFVSRRLDDSWTKWSEPVNLGKYINTLEDDADLSIPASGKLAYIVRRNSPEGYGNGDIYKFLMPYSMRPEQLFKLYGFVFNEKDSVAEVNIRFIDMATNTEVTKATSSAENGYYTVSLPLNKKYLAVIDMKGYLYYSEVIDLTDPDKYRKRYTFQQKIKLQRARLDELKIKLDAMNIEMDNLNKTESTNLRETFDKYEKLTNEYNNVLEEIEKLIYQAKYDWMTENEEDLSLQKDFHVKRAIIGATFELKNIFFETGSAVLKDDSKAELDKLVEILKNSEIVIELGGHTDSIGSDEANQKLSQDRVESVKKYLVDKGINTNRIVAVGYGEKTPIAPNATPEGRQLNRRVEVKILKLHSDKEGKDVVTDDDKKKKKDKDPERIEIKKGEMLPVLQAAARKGGLPSGSDCNSESYTPKYTYNKGKDKPYKPGSYKTPWENMFDKDRLKRKDNIYKLFNASLINHRYKSMGGAQGVDVFFVSENLFENHFQYYFINQDTVKYGAGYMGIANTQLKPILSLPLNIIWGLDLKFFPIKETNTAYFNLNIPVGARLIFPYKGFVLAPEFYHSFGMKKTSSFPIMENRSYNSVGATLRMKIFHFGLSANVGKEISYLGYRLGVSF